MIVFLHESDFKHINDMFYCFVCLNNITLYMYLHFLTKDVCFNVAIEYFQRLRNRMYKVQHFLIKVAKCSSDE